MAGQNLNAEAYASCWGNPLAAVFAGVVDFAFGMVSCQTNQSPVSLPANAGN